jgi:hypothetical protein
MKKLIISLLFIPFILAAQPPLRLPYQTLLQTYSGDTSKVYFSGDSVKWYTNQSFFQFNKSFVLPSGKIVKVGTDTLTKLSEMRDYVSTHSGTWSTDSANYASKSYANRVWSKDSSNYASKSSVATKQNTLVSGTNIKTINGSSILGSGNILIDTTKTPIAGHYATQYDLSLKADTTAEWVARTIYVSMDDDPQTPGDDVSGNGSITAPFATIYKALSSIKKIATNVAITLQLDSGSFNFYERDNALLSSMYLNGNRTLNINGTFKDSITNLVVTQTSTDLMKVNSTSHTFAVDELRGKFLSNASGSFIVPVDQNTTNVIDIANFPSTSWTKIGRPVTILNIYSNSISVNSEVYNNPTFTFNKINAVFKVTGTKMISGIQFVGCKLDFPSSTSGLLSFNKGLLLRSCFIISPQTSTSNGILNGNSYIGLFDCVLTSTQDKLVRGISLGIGFYAYNQPVLYLTNNIFSRLSKAITPRFSNLNYVAPDNGSKYYSNKFRRCGTVLGLLSTSTDPILIKIDFKFSDLILEDVDYILYGKNCALDFQTRFLVGTPNLGFVDPASLYKGFINNEIGQRILIPGTYPEVSVNKGSTLLNNTTDSISIGDKSYNRTIELKYTALRGSTYRKGTLEVINTGSGLVFNPGSYFPVTDIGLTFTGAYYSGSSNTIKLKYTVDNTGGNVTFTYDAFRQNY